MAKSIQALYLATSSLEAVGKAARHAATGWCAGGRVGRAAIVTRQGSVQSCGEYITSAPAEEELPSELHEKQESSEQTELLEE